MRTITDNTVVKGKLHEKVHRLERAGKTVGEISQILAIPPPAVQYLATISIADDTPSAVHLNLMGGQRPKMAHKMWQVGISYAEIGEMLQVSAVRARQIIHRYIWTLGNPNLPNTPKR